MERTGIACADRTSRGSADGSTWANATSLVSAFRTAITGINTPNPADDILNIGGLTGTSEVRIYNSHGQLVLIANPDGQSREIDLSDVPAGIYILKFNTSQESVVGKFIKR